MIIAIACTYIVKFEINVRRHSFLDSNFVQPRIDRSTTDVSLIMLHSYGVCKSSLLICQNELLSIHSKNVILTMMGLINHRMAHS